jgi:hypoxanthine phosphoribosyltransferase
MKIYLSQLKIDRMIQELAYRVQASHGEFSRVVGIANGGLPVSKPLAALLDLPHESVRISHYDGSTLRETPIIEGRLSQPMSNLVVDDLIDEGWTYRTFNKHYGLEGNAFAVLHWNTAGPKPDFYIGKKPEGWICYPWNEDWREENPTEPRQVRTCR